MRPKLDNGVNVATTIRSAVLTFFDRLLVSIKDTHNLVRARPKHHHAFFFRFDLALAAVVIVPIIERLVVLLDLREFALPKRGLALLHRGIHRVFDGFNVPLTLGGILWDVELGRSCRIVVVLAKALRLVEMRMAEPHHEQLHAQRISFTHRHLPRR